MIHSHAVYRIQKNEKKIFLIHSTLYASKELKAYNQFIKLIVKKKNEKIKPGQDRRLRYECPSTLPYRTSVSHQNLLLMVE